jgi:transcriptional regulator with XRE-family HTH domain
VSDSDREHLHRAEQASLSARADPTADLPSVLGKNLKRQRTRRGYSLERLAALSGVSRAMIGQIESGKSSPTISLLLKLATALGVELDHLLTRQDARAITLLRREQSHVLTLSEGKFASRALFRREYDGNVEFYELTIAPQHREEFKAELPGARENLIVASGALTVVVGAAPPLELECGDAVAFAADVARRYVNRGAQEAVLYLVKSYAGPATG